MQKQVGARRKEVKQIEKMEKEEVDGKKIMKKREKKDYEKEKEKIEKKEQVNNLLEHMNRNHNLYEAALQTLEHPECKEQMNWDWDGYHKM